MLGFQVDDGNIGGSIDEAISGAKQQLSSSFIMKDRGIIHGRCFDLDIKLVDDSITFSMQTYFNDMIGT